MSGIDIVEVKPGDALLDQVEVLFVRFYTVLVDQGWVLPLVEGGEKLWRRSIEKTLGKLAAVFVALEDGKAVGFVHGVLRVGPSYLGGHRLGVVTHIYIEPEARAQGVSKRLVSRLEAWFQEKEVFASELHAIWANEDAVDFWEYMGYEKELLQMRKRL